MTKLKVSGDELLSIPLIDLVIWDKHIKKNYEMNLREMTNSLSKLGQTTPLIVRKKKINGEDKFEIIDGIERYLASLNIKSIKKLNCLVRKMTDKQALLLQAVNNSDDNKVSGYERALAYKAALFEESIKQKDLAEKLGIAKSTLTRRMSFLKIDQEFWDKLNETACVTDTIANEIVVLLNKNIKTKKVPHKTLINKLIKLCNDNPTLSKLKNLSKEVEDKLDIERVFEHVNEHLFTYKDSKIIFNKKITEKIDLSKLLDKLKDNLIKELPET